MSLFKSTVLLALVLFFCSFAVINNTYNLSKDYKVTIHGTSNLHNWDETVGTISGNGIIAWNADGSFDLNSLIIKMVVSSIKSTEGSAMNKNTYKALKSDVNPDINFSLNTQLRSLPANGKPFAAKVNLTIAGVTKVVDLMVTATVPSKGSIVFSGSKSINMTDYNVKPPVALLGTLRTGDAITINFKTSFATNN